jgi:intracellular sulfur oxidation DsrE/DsrF family protein
MSSTSPDRRRFIGAIASATATVSLAAALPATAGAAPHAPTGANRAAAPWDDSWLQRITGTHKQVFDCTGVEDGGPLGGVRNWWNAHKDAYDLTSPNATAVVVLRGATAVMALDDVAWEKYPIGKLAKVKDSVNPKKFATRNVFKSASPGADAREVAASMMALLERGTIFVVCNNALTGWARYAASSLKGANGDEVKSFFVSHLIPGITIVPAGVQAVGLAQEKGCSYCYLAD